MVLPLNERFIDLHVHSNYSDGLRTVGEIITMAKRNQVSFLAFAEH